VCVCVCVCVSVCVCVCVCVCVLSTRAPQVVQFANSKCNRENPPPLSPTPPNKYIKTSASTQEGGLSVAPLYLGSRARKKKTQKNTRSWAQPGRKRILLGPREGAFLWCPCHELSNVSALVHLLCKRPTNSQPSVAWCIYYIKVNTWGTFEKLYRIWDRAQAHTLHADRRRLVEKGLPMCCGEGLTKTKMAKAEMGLEMCCGVYWDIYWDTPAISATGSTSWSRGLAIWFS
jgi:hypothetical protein